MRMVRVCKYLSYDIMYVCVYLHTHTRTHMLHHRGMGRFRKIDPSRQVLLDETVVHLRAGHQCVSLLLHCDDIVS